MYPMDATTIVGVIAASTATVFLAITSCLGIVATRSPAMVRLLQRKSLPFFARLIVLTASSAVVNAL